MKKIESKYIVLFSRGKFTVAMQMEGFLMIEVGNHLFCGLGDCPYKLTNEGIILHETNSGMEADEFVRKARIRANSEDFLEEVGNGNMQRPFYQSFVNILLGLAKNLEREISNGTK